ncbi:hypothetical protein PIN31115_02098 [Pandoraea iniqua]|uniref:Uncharacterized protein n=1 Tax=Pandoraea iniqua TaxID=2508288 RepID=A0A5E4ULJ9_9BURK|nr:hypothetical protein [Pandoraea iniqua]VVE00918.1 hypothetical protein PIN31115_02098 [Pandoraea iniqua]
MATTIYIRVNSDGDLTDYSPSPQDPEYWPGFIETDTNNPAYVAWYNTRDPFIKSTLPVPGT